MKTKIGLATLAVALTAAAVFSNSALAYQGDPTKRGPNCSEELHQQMLTMLKNADYDSWSQKMSGKGVARFVNQANFKEYAEARLAAEKGDMSKLNAFKVKYGMGQGTRSGMGMGRKTR